MRWNALHALFLSYLLPPQLVNDMACGLLKYSNIRIIHIHSCHSGLTVLCNPAQLLAPHRVHIETVISFGVE